MTLKNPTSKLLTFFRKHNFKPVIDETCVIIANGDEVYRFPKYVCSKCGDTLRLEEWQMRALPWGMARGCRGTKNQ